MHYDNVSVAKHIVLGQRPFRLNPHTKHVVFLNIPFVLLSSLKCDAFFFHNVFTYLLQK
jgi:hypothetical protein